MGNENGTGSGLVDGPVIVTGASGFIGSKVVEILLRQERSVIALVRPESAGARLERLPGLTRVTVEGSTYDQVACKLVEKKPAAWLHCAWRGVLGGERNEGYQVTSNLPVVVDSVRVAAAIGCKRWIGLGSQAEYGNPNCITDENTPPRPATTYGKAKLAAGVASLALAETLSLSAAWLRVFSTYGPGDNPEWFIPYIIHKIRKNVRPQLTKCDQLWDYLYIDDLAAAIAQMALSRANGVFNVGSGHAIPLRTIVELILAEMSSELVPDFGAITYRPDQVMHLQADISRLTSAIPWAPATTIKEGIRRTVKFFRTE